jgi:hypothetical protein
MGIKEMKRLIYLVLFLVAVLIIGILILETGFIHVSTRKAFAIEEPLLIESENQNSYSILPAGAVLYLDKSWPEGHDTYHVYFHFKGDFKAAPVDSNVIAPLWLRTVDSAELGKIVKDYPLSRDELTALLKAKRVTKQDLAQILNDWEE